MYVTAYRRTGKRVSRNKEGNCRFTSIALISRQTRTVNDTRRSLTRVHVEFSYVPSMCKYIYVCMYIRVYVCVEVFFSFRNCFQRPVIANCRLDQGKLIEFVDHRWTLLSSTYRKMVNVKLYIVFLALGRYRK